MKLTLSRSVTLILTQASNRIEVVSTPAGAPGESTPTDLLKVKYVRAQRESPEFDTLYEGIDQTVDVRLSTLVFHVEPEPIQQHGFRNHIHPPGSNDGQPGYHRAHILQPQLSAGRYTSHAELLRRSDDAS